MQGQWQLESPAKEYLEQVTCCHDTDCTERMMMQGYIALKSGEWEQFFFKKTLSGMKWKVSEWAFDRIKEVFEKVAKDESRKLTNVQEKLCQKVQTTCGALPAHYRASGRGKEALR